MSTNTAVAGELGPRFAAFESQRAKAPNMWLVAVTVTLATFMELRSEERRVGKECLE